MWRTFKKISMLTLMLAAVTLSIAGCLQTLYPKPGVVGPSTTRQTPPETPPKAPQSGQPDEYALLSEAQKAQAKGQDANALAQFEAFLSKYPDSTYRPSALAAAGQIREKLGRTNEAVTAYQELLSRYPKSRFYNQAALRLAEIYLRSRQYGLAIPLIEQQAGLASDLNQSAHWRLMSAKAHLGQGNRVAALQAFLATYGETQDPIDKNEAERGVRATILAMEADELAQAKINFQSGFPKDYLTYILAYRLYEKGRFDEARVQANEYLQAYPNNENAVDAQALVRAIDGLGPPPRLAAIPDFDRPGLGGTDLSQPGLQPGPIPTGYRPLDVACLLPLSENQWADYGQRVKKGLELAFRSYRSQNPGFNLNLVPYDTKGDPARTVQYVAEAGSMPNIIAAVGPLLSVSAEAAAPAAEQFKLPLVAISQKEGITQAGQYVFRLFLTPEAQARAVARYAVQILGMRNLAILYPSDNYGQTMQTAFQQEVRRLGGQVVSQVAYGQNVMDFSEQIQELAGVGKADRKVAAGKEVNVPFEAVFIPDSDQVVSMIAPQFPYHDITSVRLLGTALWHTPKLLTSGARYVQQSVIPTAFYRDSPRPEVQTFVKLAKEAERIDDATADEMGFPDKFEAYGYDAGMVLLTALDKYNVTTREDLVRVLKQMGSFQGVTGRFYFDGFGEYISEPILLTVEGETFRPIQ